MENEYFISTIVSEEECDRAPFAVVCSKYYDGNVMDVYGNDEDEARTSAESIVESLNTIAELNAEIERLRAAVHDAANKIFFMPTWVEGDSYGAQIDMRRRCYEVVAAMVKIE